MIQFGLQYGGEGHVSTSIPLLHVHVLVSDTLAQVFVVQLFLFALDHRLDVLQLLLQLPLLPAGQGRLSPEGEACEDEQEEGEEDQTAAGIELMLYGERVEHPHHRGQVEREGLRALGSQGDLQQLPGEAAQHQ